MLKSQYEAFKWKWKGNAFEIFIMEMEDLPTDASEQCEEIPDNAIGRLTIYMMRAFKAGWEAHLILHDFEEMCREKQTSIKNIKLKYLIESASAFLRDFVEHENRVWNEDDDKQEVKP